MATARRNAASVFSGACPEAPRCAITNTFPVLWLSFCCSEPDPSLYPNIRANPHYCSRFCIRANLIISTNRTLEENSMSPKSRPLLPFCLGFLMLSGAARISTASQQSSKAQRDAKSEQNLAREVRHQLVLLPYYSVFDNLAFKLDGDHVTLEGQVTRPTLKSDAEAAVKSIESVSGVTNNIEVLPLSPMDDQLRHALYRAIYGD